MVGEWFSFGLYILLPIWEVFPHKKKKLKQKTRWNILRTHMCFYNELQQKVSAFSQIFYLQNFWTDGSKIHSIFHTSWNSFNMMISFGMSSQEITKLYLHYFPGRRCFDGLFPESGNKAGIIKSLWNADLISREMARKTTCRRNGRSGREWWNADKGNFHSTKLFKGDGGWKQWCSRKTELQPHNSTR